jgi:LEA14-like dessication related protein
MRLCFLSVLFIFLSSSCSEFEELAYKGLDGIKFVKFENKKLVLDIGVKIDNPNSFSITVKPSIVDILIDDQLLVKAKLITKVKFLKKTATTYRLPIEIDIEEGAYFKLLKYTLRKNVSIRIKGKVKVCVFGIVKRTMIDEIK